MKKDCGLAEKRVDKEEPIMATLDRPVLKSILKKTAPIIKSPPITRTKLLLTPRRVVVRPKTDVLLHNLAKID